MARPPYRLLLTTQDDTHLAVLRRLVRGLEKDSEKIFERSPLFSPAHHVSTLIIALLNLAKRNLRPASIFDGGGGEILFDLLQDFVGESKTHVIDETHFADHCCSFLRPLQSLDRGQCLALVASLKANTKQTRARAKASPSSEALIDAVATSPVSVGWAHEYLNQEKPSRVDDPEKSRYLTPTQFFTPAGIAQTLVEQAVKNCGNGRTTDIKLLDPACGAGHLLVPALRCLFGFYGIDSDDNSDLANKWPARVAALNNLLSNCIYGLDVDVALIDLARFAIYLTARDLEAGPSKPAELPAPKLSIMQKPLGSLALIEHTQAKAHEQGAFALPASFDAIVMNPPYLSTRTMDDTTRKFLRSHFSAAAGDLYTAFIELGISLLAEGGCISTVVQQSFLSIARYRRLRLSLLHEHNLLSSIILGTGAFPSRPGEKVNNVIITVQRRKARQESSEEDGEAGPALYFHRLADDKQLTLSQQGAQNLVAQITGQPFAFHCPPDVSAIFSKYPQMADRSLQFDLTNGLFTCNNQLFIKSAAQVEALPSLEERERYVPYDKGGGHKWFHATPHRLDWGTDGQSIRDYRVQRGQSRSLPGEQFYFQPGVTYSYIGTKGFKARLLSEGAVFDIASSAIFSRRFDLDYLLGFLNSALVAYLLSLLNPTINFQIGDLRKLPFKEPGSDLESEIKALAHEAVALVKSGAINKATEAALLAQIQSRIDVLIFDHYAVSKSDRANISADPWVSGIKRL